jgi:metacaspase-1
MSKPVLMVRHYPDCRLLMFHLYIANIFIYLIAVSNVATFQLPDPAGRAGGACTSAMLQVLYKDHQDTSADLTFQQVLLKMRNVLSKGSYQQIPQLTSSRPLDIQHKFDIVPEQCTGTRRAVMIGINYTGQQGQLSGCHNDVNNMLEYIKTVHGFQDENITVLLDAEGYTQPTYDNMLAAYKKLVSECQAGDAVFCHYSGHGGKLRDDDGDEKDGYDETLVPVDFQTASQLRDDDVFSALIGPMPSGVVVTCVMDCCHSGTVLDLPFQFIADGEHDSMQIPADFNFKKLQKLFDHFLQIKAAVAAGKDPVAAVSQICCAMM